MRKMFEGKGKPCRTLWVIISLVCTICLAGCKATKPYPVYIHDTLAVKQEVHDSTYIERWHTQWMKGDTCFIHDSIYLWRDRTKHDTVYKSTEKPVPVTEYVEVEKPLSWWEKTFIGLGVIELIALVCIAVWKTKRWWIKLFV